MWLCFISMLVGAYSGGRNIRGKSLPGERTVVIAVIVPS